MFHRSRRPLTCLLAWSTALTFSALLGACSGDEADGLPEYDELQGYGGPQNAAGNNPGVNNTPGQPAQNSAPGSNGSTGNTPSTNAPPSTIPTTNTPPNSEGNPTAAPINNGANTGANAGNNPGAMAPGAGGAGAGMGNDNSPDPGTAGTPATTPPVVTPPTPPVVTPPAAPDIPCPAGATFCAGFESDTLPAGAIYQPQPVVPLEFDTTVKHSGNRSLKVVSAGSFNMREVIAPIPGQAFWVRLFVQTSNVFGDNDHDSLFVASTASPSQDNNDEHGPEFSEQGEQIVLNADDQLFSAAGRGFPQSEGPKLSANTWHCEEAFYDGGTGNTQFFHDGEQIIDAAGFTRLSYQTFRFGYIGFNTVRTVWFDDVVVASNRVGCP